MNLIIQSSYYNYKFKFKYSNIGGTTFTPNDICPIITRNIPQIFLVIFFNYCFCFEILFFFVFIGDKILVFVKIILFYKNVKASQYSDMSYNNNIVNIIKMHIKQQKL